MDPNRSSIIPIQHRPIQKNTGGSSSPDDRNSIWKDMHGWMEQRQREWDDEMAQLKNEFFTLKTTTMTGATATPSVDDRASRRSSDASLQDRMSISSSSGRGGLGDISRGRTFRITFDVGQFKPEEINVRTQENSLIVRAKHEEKHEKKSISREFNRRVDIPTSIDPQALQCSIRDDGTLLVEAELPPDSYDSSSYTRDSPSLMENSSAHSVFSDRLSDGDTCSPPRTDREDAYSPSSLDWSVYRPTRETGRPSHHGIDRDDLTPQRTYPERDVYSWPRTKSDHLEDLRPGNSQRPTGRIGSTDAGYGNDLINELFKYQRELETEFPPSGPNRTIQNHRLTNCYSNDSGLESCSHNTFDRDLPRRWNDLPKENGNVAKYSDPDVFSVVVDIGTDFEPHELEVKAIDNKLVVHARHSNPYTGHWTCDDVYREFDLPYDVEPETITANLTPEGILIIEAPTNGYNYTTRSPYSANDTYFYNS